MTLIDLGELRDEPAPEASRPPRSVGRPFRILLALVVMLATLTAGAPPARPRVSTLPGGLGAAVFISGDGVFVVRLLGPSADATREIVAYRADRERWRRRLPGPGTVVSVWEYAGRVLVLRQTGDDQAWDTVAYDAGTGAPAWRQPGAAISVGEALLIQPVAGAARQPVRRVDPVDGRTLWTAPTTGELQFGSGSAGLDRLLLTAEAGRAVVLDVHDGTRLAARDLRLGGPLGRRRVVVADGLLLEFGALTGVVNAYDLTTLRPRWTVTLPSVGYVDPCGALLCAVRQSGGMWGLDPATGAVRWSVARWSGVVTAGAGRLLVGATDAGGGLAVLDAADGRVVADLGQWSVIPGYEVGGPLFVTRSLSGGRLLLAEADTSGDPPRPRDVFSGSDCESGTTLLACRNRDADVELWRLR
ncbi:PQQ-binding-like beta-propeller repeat protein [Micromonospora sp. DT31]|uniref:outer membrane protein assembly factor BamB family protein n=1 Tax=Micromonospora sp. DT31 TaxID=3393434 RepID=UPI003CF4161F